jgi:hypothetical protein
MARDKFLIEVCSPKHVSQYAGGNTKEEAEVVLQKLENEGWVRLRIKENPLTNNEEHLVTATGAVSSAKGNPSQSGMVSPPKSKGK